jgi:hypothetical protein
MAWSGIYSKATAAGPPFIAGLGIVWTGGFIQAVEADIRHISTVEKFAIGAIMSAIAEGAPMADAAALLFVTDQGNSLPALGLLGSFGDDIDHPIHGVGPPKGGSRASDDLDAIDIFNHRILNIPEYTRKYMKNFMKGYFSNSFKEMVSFFAKEDNMSITELEELMKEVGKDLEDIKNKSDE